MFEFDGGAPLSVLLKDTQANLPVFLYTILYAEPDQAGSCEYQFSEVFCMTRPGIELLVYRSITWTLEPLRH